MASRFGKPAEFASGTPRALRRVGGLATALAVVAALSLGGCPDAGTGGAQGEVGPAGPQGPAGPAGAQGAQGEQGAAGSAGAQGEPGLPGAAGADGAAGAQGPQGVQGQPGVPGADGANGQLRIYGDGSAGSRTVSADETLADTNRQYTNFTVDAGVTLTVPSGVVIRCTGTFTNNGTITVQTAASGSRQSASSGTGHLDGTYAPAEAGVALAAAAPGEFGDNSSTRNGGKGGLGVGAFIAGLILQPGPKAGGGAGGAFATDGSPGGGSFTVLAQGAIANTGTMNADGASLGIRRGGGGGGIIILGSPTSVSNTGTATANGGAGGNSDSFGGVGGGGGGGIIHYLSPSITAGTTSVTGGAAGVAGGAGSVSTSPRQGGGGGGACVGNGGTGGSVSSGGNPSAAGAGTDGVVLESMLDPTALF